MRKLLSAEVARLWKSRIFWLTMLFMGVGSYAFSCLNYQTSMKFDDRVLYVEDVLFNLFPMLSFVSGIFIALFLGTEFDENTIRNKLIVGHTRTEIFFAVYLTCMLASVLQLSAMLLVSGIAGWDFFREFMMEPVELFFLIFCCLLVTVACVGIFTAVGMNIHSRAGSVVIAMVLVTGMLFLTSFISSRLAEGEMVYSSVTITMDGVQYGDLVKNPAYVGGNMRTVLEYIYDLLPTGQAAQINNMEFDRCQRWPVLSGLLLIAATAAGFCGFRKKDIR